MLRVIDWLGKMKLNDPGQTPFQWALVVLWAAVQISAIVCLARFFSRAKGAVEAGRRSRSVITGTVVFTLLACTLIAVEPRSFWVLSILLVVVPGVAVIELAAIILTRRCGRCGTASFDYNLFSPMRCCSKCGLVFEHKPKTLDDASE